MKSSGSKRSSRLLRQWKSPLLIALFFVIVEVFVFNLPFWQTLGAQPVNTGIGKLGPGLELVGDHSVKVVDDQKEYREIDSAAPINYFYVNPSDGEADGKTQSWQMDTRKDTDGDWYLSDIEHAYSPQYNNSRYFHVGNSATHLRLRYTAPEGSVFPVSALTVNTKVPLRFPLVRICIEIFLVMLIIAFRPASGLYKRHFSLRDPVSSIGLVIVLAIQIIAIITVWRLWGGTVIDNHSQRLKVGVYTDPGQYNQLADALIHGHVNLDLPVNKDLAQMQNPYDAATRFQIAQTTSDKTPIYLDVAFWEGKYYSYFGVLPAILLFMPYKLLTGHDLPTTWSILLLDIVVAIAAMLLVVQIARLLSRRSKHVSIGAVLLASSAFVIGLPLFQTLRIEMFYQPPQTLALALTLLALACWIESKLRGLSKGWLAAGAFLLALTLASRPQFILAVFIAFPLFWDEIRKLFMDGRRSWKGLLRELGVWACALVPVIVVVIPVLLYNRVRFGSLFDFGANYNLTGFDMTHSHLPWSEVISLVYTYLFQAPNIAAQFPFFRGTVVDFIVSTPTQTYPYLGGLFTTIAPFALIVFALFGYKRQLRRMKATGFVAGLAAAAVVIFVFDVHQVGVDTRYILDFGWAIMALFAVAVLVVDAQRNSLVDCENLIPEIGGGFALPRHFASSSRMIGCVLVGVVMAVLFTFFSIFDLSANLYNKDLWWNVYSWFLFV